MTNLYPHFSTNSTVASYLPDYKKDEFPDKVFFYGILSTLYPEEVSCLVKTARSNQILDRDEGVGELVKISKEILEDLKNQLSPQVR